MEREAFEIAKSPKITRGIRGNNTGCGEEIRTGQRAKWVTKKGTKGFSQGQTQTFPPKSPQKTCRGVRRGDRAKGNNSGLSQTKLGIGGA